MYVHCVLQDTIPELSEVFLVRLTAIELVNNILNTVPPSLGSATVTQVEVNPNDNPQGVITFELATYAALYIVNIMKPINYLLIGIMLVKTLVSSTSQ